MRFYKLEQWYRIPENETVILNTNYLWGKHRFVKRTRDISQAHAQVKPLLHSMRRETWESWNVGSGYTWEPQGKQSFFLAVHMQDELTAMQFELTFC
jgi:hypothetical protein